MLSKQTKSRLFRWAVIIAGLSALSGAGRLRATEPKTTEMAPFEVKAEFGVDGLRIQNSNSVLNPYLLQQHGVTQLQDITGIAPNLVSSNSDSRGFGDVIALRGVANSIFFSPPSVALYVDDAPSGSVSSYPSSLLNIDNLSVKAGPQGTDYGRNAPGGVIDIRNRAPGTSHQGKIQASYGSFKAVDVEAMFDGPLSQQVGYSAGFSYNEREGYIDNTYLKRSADDRTAVAGRGSLYWKPTDSLQVRFGIFLEKVDDDATRLSSLFSPDPYVVASDLNGVTQLERRQFTFQLKKTFDWFSLVATSSRQEWDIDPSSTDLDLSPQPLAFSQIIQSEDIWTQEVRFESTSGADQTQWRAGMFYFDSNIDGNAFRQFVVPPSQFVPPGFIQSERTRFALGGTSFAGYANLSQPLSKDTTARIGVRLEKTDAELTRTKLSSNNFGFPSPQDPVLDRSQGHSYFSASGGLVHSVSDSLNLQARTSLAHKPAGYSAFTANPNLAGFKDERIWSSEVGLTFGPPNGRFGGSVLGFWNRMRDYQFERTVPNSTDYVVVNADRVTARGLEAKFMWNPVDHVWWDFQAGYTDAKFDDHRDSLGTQVNGRRVPFIPRSTLRTGVTVDLGQGFAVNASYTSIGRSYYDERNTATFSQKSYGLVNAQLRYRSDRYTVAVYGHNLFKEEYYQFINPEIYAGSPGAPRRFGVQASYEF